MSRKFACLYLAVALLVSSIWVASADERDTIQQEVQYSAAVEALDAAGLPSRSSNVLPSGEGLALALEVGLPEEETISLSQLPTEALKTSQAQEDAARRKQADGYAFPADDIPPVLPTFLSFRFMVACAGLFVLLAIAAWWWRKDLENHPLLMKALIYVIPLPYLGIMAGWAVAEIGRQPWIVYGLMRTSDAVSPVPTSSVGLSLAAFIVIYTFLGILDIYLLRKYAKKGPEAAPEAQA